MLMEEGDAFLFGPDLLVAPVTEYGARSRRVYLPRGADWTDPWSGQTHPGGTEIVLDAPLERAPVLVREGAEVPIVA
jgi:alpha-D-xyloside xylohydrolase